MLHVGEYWTVPRIQREVQIWREKNKHTPICAGFCKLFGTDACLAKLALPRKGYCESFVVKATTVDEMQKLFDIDVRVEMAQHVKLIPA